jgi:hypothetical protein
MKRCCYHATSRYQKFQIQFVNLSENYLLLLLSYFKYLFHWYLQYWYSIERESSWIVNIYRTTSLESTLNLLLELQ